MNTSIDLHARVDEYLAERRRMGFGLVHMGYALQSFSNYVASACHQGPLAVATAVKTTPTLEKRQLSPHTIRHTTAMHLLQSGVDISVIALWLGHESPSTTHQYVEADLAMKDRALARLQEPDETVLRYRAPDSLLEFLKTL